MINNAELITLRNVLALRRDGLIDRLATDGSGVIFSPTPTPPSRRSMPRSPNSQPQDTHHDQRQRFVHAEGRPAVAEDRRQGPPVLHRAAGRGEGADPRKPRPAVGR